MELVGSSAPAAPRLVRKPRKKFEAPEDLPEDYQYPKKYTKPSLDMLERPVVKVITNLTEQLQDTSTLLEETLRHFDIEARVTDVTRGPTITRFELEPAPGIKVSRFLALADNIALSLKAHRVRVEAPIPGKSRVGIEVPNYERDPVVLRELLESPVFKRAKGRIKLPLGKDIAGDVIVADLTTMPHLLVAGATGSGKTVFVKELLASLLFNHTPDELQLMLIDPKMVEFSIFNDIPHLITPVVIDPKKAATSLTWLINEMEERYRLFAELRVRNIEVYNESVDNGEIQLEGSEGEENESVDLVRKLPYIVCIIDELADLMMLARAEVEDAIARLAQLARAVGIHLILATQRPSVDVLTGVIKANFPARISFQVSSRVDSRCILDEIGAERLIGNGDLLYLPAGQSKPQRMQGAFVSDDEMHALVAYLKTQAPPQYRDEIENFGKTKDKLQELLEEDDPLFDEAVQVVLETGQASISMVQRRLRVGYTRAARLIDLMELKGIVGPHTGSKARDILVNHYKPQDGNE
jgi:S-DNA-T family DNA segregation ATPase FtsK/SpoIIIE